MAPTSCCSSTQSRLTERGCIARRIDILETRNRRGEANALRAEALGRDGAPAWHDCTLWRRDFVSRKRGLSPSRANEAAVASNTAAPCTLSHADRRWLLAGIFASWRKRQAIERERPQRVQPGSFAVPI